MFPPLSGYMIPGKIMGKNESSIVRSRYTVDSEPRLSSCFTEGQSRERLLHGLFYHPSRKALEGSFMLR